jgi:TonB family protein
MMNLLWEAALKGTVILAAAWLAATLLKRASADLRHRIWLAALIGLLALMLPVPVPEPARIAVVDTGFPNAAAGAFRARSSWIWESMWLAGAVAMLARAALGLVRLHRLTRRTQPMDANTVLSNILISDAVDSPLTWGLRRPVVLLPAYALNWSPDQHNRAIRHEMAHVERRDWLWQTFAQVLTAFFWFHPLVWLAASRLRKEAEHAADDLVVLSGAAPPEYAAQLLEVARRVQSSSALPAVAMVRKPALEDRIAAILDPLRHRAPAGRRSRAGIGGIALVLIAALAACSGSAVHRMGEAGLKAPSLASKVEPEYSQEAKDGKLQGTVVLRLVVDEHGLAQNIVVSKPLGKGLDEKAIEAIRKWHFNPGEKDGKPVRVAATVEVNFRLL